MEKQTVLPGIQSKEPEERIFTVNYLNLIYVLLLSYLLVQVLQLVNIESAKILSKVLGRGLYEVHKQFSSIVYMT